MHGAHDKVTWLQEALRGKDEIRLTEWGPVRVVMVCCALGGGGGGGRRVGVLSLSYARTLILSLRRTLTH